MSLPLFNSCCGCIPLRTGTLLIGYLNLICSGLGIILALFLIITGAMKKAHTFISRYPGHELASMMNIIYVVIGVILLILFVVQLIFVIFLLIGGHRGKSKFIKAYLVFSVVMMVISFTLSLVYIREIPPTFILYVISYGLEIYFLLVIRSYMKKLEDNAQNDLVNVFYKPLLHP